MGRGTPSGWGRAPVALLALISTVAVGGCGSSHPVATTPTTVVGPCQEPAANQAAQMPPAAVLASAALLSATITVTATRVTADGARCTALAPGASVQLRIGDAVEYVANMPPQFDAAEAAVVATSSRPGPLSTGPGGPGGLRTSHVVVRIVGETPGVVHLRWTDCSGTGC